MRTKEEIGEIMSRIFETGGLTEDMEKDLKSLKDELDEREGMLARYGEKYDGEKAETGETAEWEAKYNELVERYDSLKERYKTALFFPGGDETVIEPTEETVEEPDKYAGLTVEQLFN